jgi:sugar phosphate isomerase/epimerase
LVASTLEAKGRIGYVHFADTNRKTIGEGDIDYRSVLLALKKVQFNGVIGLEYVPSELGWDNQLQPERKQQILFARSGLNRVKQFIKGIAD